MRDNGERGEPPAGGPGGEQILLVGNPTSRQGKAAARIEEARELLVRRGLEHDFRETLPDGETTGMVAGALQERPYRTVIYLGGDGTFNEVAKGICLSGRASEVRIGMLPSGTANDQGKSFGISSRPRAIEENVDVIAADHTTRLDVGEVKAIANDGTVLRRDLFFDSIGWGLSAAILQFRNRELDAVKSIPIWRDMYRDHMVYIRAAVHQLGLAWLTRDHFAAELDRKSTRLNSSHYS